MIDTPKLSNIIKNDTGAFLCAWVPAAIAILATVSFIVYESDRNNYSALEITYISPLLFISISVCLWPFILWWWRSIYITFRDGIELKAVNTNPGMKYVFDLGISYTFEHRGKKIDHIASLIPNRTTKEIAGRQSFSIVFNPDKNLSFITNVYIQ